MGIDKQNNSDKLESKGMFKKKCFKSRIFSPFEGEKIRVFSKKIIYNILREKNKASSAPIYMVYRSGALLGNLPPLYIIYIRGER